MFIYVNSIETSHNPDFPVSVVFGSGEFDKLIK